MDVRVLDDLHPVAPRIAEVESPPGKDLDSGLLEGGANGRPVVDDEPEVARRVIRLGSPLRERDELVAAVDEGHSRHPAPKLEIEDLAVERQRPVDVTDLQGDVVDPDRPGARCQPLPVR